MLLDYKSYGESVDQLQQTLYYLLKEDTNVASFVQIGDNKFNIYDGDPSTQGRIGFPYIVVHTPTFTENHFTQRKKEVRFNIKVEIIDKKEKNVRQLADAVITALASKNMRMKVKGFMNQRILNTSLSSRFLPNESSKAVWVYILNVRYIWRGFKNVYN